MSLRCVSLLCLFLVLDVIAAYGATWNVATDFSSTQNPNGAWSFGWRTTTEQPMVLYTDNGPEPVYNCDVQSWRYDIDSGCPCVGHNPNDYDYQCGPGALVFPAYSAWFHAGPAQQSVVRWTASESGPVQLFTHFKMLDTGSAVVHIYNNGSEIFTAPLNQLGHTADYTTTLDVLQGALIDCAVSPVSFYCSSTQMDVTLTTADPVPIETTTWGAVKKMYQYGGL